MLAGFYIGNATTVGQCRFVVWVFACMGKQKCMLQLGVNKEFR